MPGCLCEGCKRPVPPRSTRPTPTAEDRRRDADADWRDRYREDPE